MRRVLAIVLASAILLLVGACSEKSPLEKAIEAMNRGAYEYALKELRSIPEQDRTAQVKQLIEKAREEVAKKKNEECKQLAKDRFKLASEAKTAGQFDELISKLRKMNCKGLDVKPMVKEAYVKFIAYLSNRGNPDDYTAAVERYCEIEKCSYKPPRTLIYEEVVKFMDQQGNVKKEEVVQEEIPMVDHERAMAMFDWLIKQNPEYITALDKYARFLNRMERFDMALDAFKKIAEYENAPFQIKDRAKLMVEHLKPLAAGKKKPERKEGEEYQYFWIEEVKKKSKLGGLKKDMEQKQEEKQEQAPPAGK